MAKFYRAERLKSLREIVVIIFNKFLTKDVRYFPQELSFGSKNDGGKGLKYELVGKVEHAGTRVSGHYWAHSLRVNNQSSKWTKLNDTGVSIGDPAPTAGTFMIVYHLVNPAAK
jgi:hypothetical protein